MSKRFPMNFTEPEHKAVRMAAAQAEMTMQAFIKRAVAEMIARQCAAQAVGAAEAPATLPLRVLAEAGDKPA